MDAQERLLVDAVLEAPEADEPRVVYADWLQQRGDPRGEFVALQLEIAAGRASPAVFAREAELRDRHAVQWLRELGLAASQGTFARGFVERVELRDASIAQLLAAIARIEGRSPLRTLTFRAIADQKLDEDAAATLFASRALAHVGSLELSCCKFSGDALAALVSAPHLGALSTLVLDEDLIDDDDLLIIADAPALAELRHLRLADNLVDAEGLATITRVFPGLVSLDLSSNVLDEDDLGGLVEGPGATELVSLELGDNSCTGRVFARLADASHLRLSRLGLASNMLEDDGFFSIGEARHLAGLVHLDLGDNIIDDEGIEELVPALVGTRLQTLSLGANFFGRPGARALARAEHLGELRKLDVRNSEHLRRQSRAVLARRFGDRVLLDSSSPLDDDGTDDD